MKFETLKKDNKKKIAIGIIAVISIILVGVFATTFAKYKLTQSIPLVRGTINYKAYDFKIMAMYLQKEESTCIGDSCYEEIETMPESGYKINEAKSYCTLDNKNKDNNVKLYTMKTGEHVVAKLSRNDKCYLYFDEIKAVDTILFGITPKDSISDMFKNIATTDEGVFKVQDNDGTSYYYRGAVTNNYLNFAGFWWRIVRINGDGTIRIIYDGTTYHANGTSTSNSIAVTSKKFNTSSNNAIYVGFKYGATDEGRGLANKSIILTALETWYDNNLATYASKIDMNAGFCGDRTAYTDSVGTELATGYGSNRQYFADSIRLGTNKAPIVKCENELDLYTMNGSSKGNKALEKPIGLINANEVAMAGGKPGSKNESYFLYNNNNYWTISPSSFNNNYAYVFRVNTDGNLGIAALNQAGNVGFNNVTYTAGTRPVINLRSDVLITGSGTGTDPFIVN